MAGWFGNLTLETIASQVKDVLYPFYEVLRCCSGVELRDPDSLVLSDLA